MNQSIARRNLSRGASQARRLIASAQHPAQFILNTTIEDCRIEKPVQRCRAEVGFVCGSVVVLPGDAFYLVASPKFAHRFYVVVQRNNQWQCSSREAAQATRCINQVQAARRSGRSKAA